MALPALYALNRPLEEEKVIPPSVVISCLVIDGAAITALCLGILGSLSLIAIPKAACYAMIGVGAVSLASWIAIVIATKGEAILELNEFFKEINTHKD